MKNDSYDPADDPELRLLAELEKQEELNKQTGTAAAGRPAGTAAADDPELAELEELIKQEEQNGQVQPADTGAQDDPELRLLAELEKQEELKKSIEARRQKGQ